MSVPGRSRRRLMLWVYLVGVVQVLIASGSLILIFSLLKRAPWEHEPVRARALINTFAELLDDPVALQRALAHFPENTMTFRRLDGTLISSTPESFPPLASEQLERLKTEPWLVIPAKGPAPISVVPIRANGVVVAYGMAQRRPPPYPLPSSKFPLSVAIGLAGGILVAFFFGRSLVRPLARLAAAARAFGDGDLGARSGVHRNDELGEVAQTFDEMADRVNALLRAQSEFLANVSHELRTPLARIRVALDIAAEGDVQAARRCLIEIGQDWGDLDRLVEGVLSMARLDLARDPAVPAITYRREEVDLKATLERAATSFRGQHPQHELQLSTEGELGLIGDEDLLRRVIDNLLNNAAKYSDPGAPIDLVARNAGDHVEVEVQDRGIGIDEQDLPRLFEPFFRSDRSRARKTGGAGIGLALAKRIVSAHGGTIEVDSELGRRTTVRFTVPVTLAADAAG